MAPSDPTAESTAATATAAGALRRVWDGDLLWNFRHSPVAIVSAVVLVVGMPKTFSFCVRAVVSEPTTASPSSMMS